MTARLHAGLAVVGLAFGFALSRLGFTDWAEVHRMFTFRSLRLTLAFATAVVLAAMVLYVLRLPPRPDDGRSLVRVVGGAVLFGTGWAICGCCPAAMLALAGQGSLTGAVALAGMVLGMAVVPRGPGDDAGCG